MTARATDRLREEHRLILAVVDAFDVMLGRTVEADVFDDVGRCLSFFRLYTDACHHGSEEDLLFAELAEHGVPADAGPVAALREEHRQGRALVAAMGAAAAAIAAGESGADNELRRLGRSYTAFLRDHIQREDGGLFELADELVRGASCARLRAGYEAVCSRRFDGRTAAELEADAARLVDRYTSR